MSEFYGAFLKSLTMWQYKLNMLISSNIRAMEGEDVMIASLTILGIAFIYGVIHAAGPGHGKALVGFYFLRNGGSYKKAIKMGYLISLIHATSALVITFTIYFIIEGIFSKTFHEVSHLSMKISAILIMLVGIYLLIETYKERKRQEDTIPTVDKSDFAIAFSAGVVPCPGVMTITLFSVSLGHFTLGVMSAVVMSIGMGLTISLAGVLSVLISKQADSKIAKYSYILQYFGALLVLGLGVMLAFGAFNH